MIQKFYNHRHNLYNHRFVLIFLILSILIIGFIFHNSLQDSKTSNDRSSSIAEVVKPVVDPAGQIEESTFHKITRKLAHGIEFCVLGCCIGGLMYSIKTVYKRYNVFMMLFILLSTAVIDEYIQSFTGRTSSVKDILIDFGGAMVGLSLAVLCELIYRLLLYRSSKKSTTKNNTTK